MKKRFLSLVALIISAVMLVLAAPAIASTAVPPDFFEKPGPHEVVKTQGRPDHTLYYPKTIASDSTRFPVVIWGNGTGARPDYYDFLLRHLASWGIVVAAANTKTSGSGEEMLAGARFLLDEDQRPGSIFHHSIDGSRIGASGHSQGGGGTLVVGSDPLVSVTVPIEPGPGGDVTTVRGPSLFITGQHDIVVNSGWVRSRYDKADQVAAIFAELRNGNHLLTNGTRPTLKGAVVAWFRYWLAGDQRATDLFFGPGNSCGLCTDTSSWSAIDRNAKAEAVQ
ncbi:acetylxylan esterase [Amycolatopsis sp. QT-25]|uniref:poly(ethylene terephthalate) hydrolase family protein n=1 Tax=Amycolatopsis sp. QT-25 TaxID=3034022 RepID=UPI0023EAAD5C|nr:acetylxylan esterase [Amycolatopsis sp. QT-25]WET81027.1 acetylxylan esterase [Amycolatopsis sp. QT-25]